MNIAKAVVSLAACSALLLASSVSLAAAKPAAKLSLTSSPALAAARVGAVKMRGKNNIGPTPLLLLAGVAITAGAAVALSGGNGGSPASP